LIGPCDGSSLLTRCRRGTLNRSKSVARFISFSYNSQGSQRRCSRSRSRRSQIQHSRNRP
ncbi:hypothetical protein V8C40DRAFT_250574, partial [Trichoderma camerunense]